MDNSNEDFCFECPLNPECSSFDVPPPCIKGALNSLWDFLCYDEVREKGYKAQESEWIPVNKERLNAAIKKMLEV